ncbi:hypothetical protein UFOVP262_28 [uncultured Caudovirales phage]|uniref:Uncharacterized protein n=1 Tax=uncultured Caudovirales phage TaxID=2100421 RepID=A0A6J5L027_9CAUD|nr:hypothetical protein UFOVP90_12 [uncultured Caudovirales phage]CAB4133796.1 hypothetical protein UFOVP262_28 [uncultured Caudovirales phage]
MTMTKEEIIEMARESGMELYGFGKDRERFVHHLTAFAKLIAKHEREACAVIAEESFCGCGRSNCIEGDLRAHDIAIAIRARGDKND